MIRIKKLQEPQNSLETSKETFTSALLHLIRKQQTRVYFRECISEK